MIDPDSAPVGAVAEIQLAIEAWNSATSAELFNDSVTVDASAEPSLDHIAIISDPINQNYM